MDGKRNSSYTKMHVGMTHLALLCLFLVTEGLSAGHVEKRSDDSNSFEIAIARLTQDVSSMKAELQALKNVVEQRAAFLANSGDVLNASANYPIRFKGVALNIGQGYDPTLGVFTAPYTGVYVMSFQLYPYMSMDITASLVRNGNTTLYMRIYDQSTETSEATSLTVHAAAGDKFWVQINRNVLLHSAAYCFFSGTLISPDV